MLAPSSGGFGRAGPTSTLLVESALLQGDAASLIGWSIVAAAPLVVLAWLLLRERGRRRVLEERLAMSDRQLAALRSAELLGEWEHDLGSGQLRPSVGLRQIFGLEDTEPVTVERLLAMVYPEDRERVSRQLTASDIPPDGYGLQYRIRRVDGSMRTLYTRVTPSEIRRGRVTGMTSVVLDVTGQQAAGVELPETEELLDLASLVVIVRDMRDRILYWNRGAERLYGWSEADVRGLHLHTVLRTSFPEPEETIDAALRRDGRWDGTLVHAARNGRQVAVVSRWTLRRDAQGEPACIIEIVEDVTERRQAEARFGAVLRACTDAAIIATDPSGVVTIFNAGAEMLLGYGAGEVIGQAGVASFCDAQELAARATALGVAPGFEVLAAIAERTGGEQREWTFVRKDGARRTVLLTTTPMRSEKGDIDGFVSIATDVTPRKEIERLKDEFISVVSHELRTPLTSIRGALGLLAGGALASAPERAQRMLELAVSNTERLIRLVNDTLDLERINAGAVRMRLAACDAAELATRAVEELRPLAERGAVAIRVEVPAVPVWADSDRIVQTLTNLLGNALKFSPAGGTIHLTAESVAGEVRFAVRDQGPGIPSDMLEVIFERFRQVDASDRRERSGTGLGLAIARDIVRQHGGRIWAESREGAGSTFHFTLPVPPPAVVAGAHPGAAELEPPMVPR